MMAYASAMAELEATSDVPLGAPLSEDSSEESFVTGAPIDAYGPAVSPPIDDPDCVERWLRSIQKEVLVGPVGLWGA